MSLLKTYLTITNIHKNRDTYRQISEWMN